MSLSLSRSGALLAVAALALTAGAAPAAQAKKGAKPRLVAFDSCRALVQYGRAGLVRTDGTVGVPMRAGSSPMVIATPSLTGAVDDKAVPPSQSAAIYEAVKAKGVPTAYLPFAGEGHGFRRAETIIAVLEAELAFLQRALRIS